MRSMFTSVMDWVKAEKRLSFLQKGAVVVAGTVVLTFSAKVQVPFYPVPMTMQTLAVIALAALMGMRLGVATVLLYLFEGAIGLPVFAGAVAGLPYMLGTTGGYLVGFVFAAALAGFITDNLIIKPFFKAFVVMALGHVVIFMMGYAWLAYLVGSTNAYLFGVAPFYLATLLKTALGAALIPALHSLYKKS